MKTIRDYAILAAVEIAVLAFVILCAYIGVSR